MASNKPESAKSKSVETSAYRVETEGLQHDGEPYAVGDTISLTPAQAAPLLAVGVISGAAPASLAA
jgi:hypothetical protein